MQEFLESFFKVGILTIDLLILLFICFDYSSDNSIKKFFRIIVLCFAYFICTFIFSFLLIKWNIFYIIFYFLIGISILLSFKFVDNCSSNSIWFKSNICIICFYITQEISYVLIESLYFNEMINDQVVEYIFHYLILFIVYIIVYFALIKNYKNNRLKIENDKEKLWFIIYYFFHTIITTFQYFVQNKKSILISLALVISFYSFVELIILYFSIRQKYSEVELSIVKQLWEKDKKYYEMQHENIEAINIKCHDLKHQLKLIKNNENIGEKMIGELENSVNIYDSIASVGNEVLDVLISDAAFQCHKYGILFTYMVDGKIIKSFDQMDAYSFFGNMLENAIECEKKVVDCKNRFISLTIRQEKNIIKIHEENYFEGEDVIFNGIINTTKSDSENHGFGTKSMKKIVKKYKGKIDFYVQDQMFQVDVEMPNIINFGKNEK